MLPPDTHRKVGFSENMVVFSSVRLTYKLFEIVSCKELHFTLPFPFHEQCFLFPFNYQKHATLKKRKIP